MVPHGEIGLDYFHKQSREQRRVFARQLTCDMELRRPNLYIGITDAVTHHTRERLLQSTVKPMHY
jgi:Tat protein secretion system quality control protein TatD with DNase activity